MIKNPMQSVVRITLRMMLRAAILILTTAQVLLVEGVGTSNRVKNKTEVAQNSTRRILFGTKALSKDFPYFTLLRFPGQEYPCGGSIIANHWVMTAAHCIRGELCTDIKIIPAVWPGRKSANPSECYSHEYSSHKYFEYDMALLKVDQDILQDGRAKAIKLPPPGLNHPIGTAVVIVGWGKTETKQFPTSLLRAQTYIEKWNKCNRKYLKETTRGTRDMPIRAVCVQGGGPAPSSGCYGDSGGPAVTDDGFVIGVASFVLFENGYCRFGGPTIYVSVVDYLPWIYKHIDPSRDTRNFFVRPEHILTDNQRPTD